MIKKFHPNLQLLAVSVIAWIAFGVLFCFVVGSGAFVSDQVEAAVTPTAAEPIPAAGKEVGVPVRIRMPGIGLDAAVERVTLAADGSMGVPVDPMNAAWYALGPRPGETGSAVIDGHVNWLRGATGVFANMEKLKPGDVLAVQDENGETYVFVVREIRTYASSADASNVFRSTDGKAHLNLITCDGAWDKTAKQYTQRLVVFADREITALAVPALTSGDEGIPNF